MRRFEQTFRPSLPRSRASSSLGNLPSISKQPVETEPFDPSIYDDEETAEIERQLDIRRSAADLLLVERAKEWLLGE